MKLTGDDLPLLLDCVYGAMAIDRAGTVVYMNEQCASYLMVDRAAAIGRPVKRPTPSRPAAQNWAMWSR